MKSKTTIRSEPALPGSTSETGLPGSHAAVKPPLPFTLKRILVPVDFSEASVRAFEYAAAMATALHATVIALHVVEPAVHAGNYFHPTATLDPANQTRLEAARERLGALGRRELVQDVSVETLVRMGHAHSEITDTAKAMAADWIVLAVHSASEAKHPIMGSTAERVVRTAPCPVLTVPPG